VGSCLSSSLLVLLPNFWVAVLRAIVAINVRRTDDIHVRHLFSFEHSYTWKSLPPRQRNDDVASHNASGAVANLSEYDSVEVWLFFEHHRSPLPLEQSPRSHKLSTIALDCIPRTLLDYQQKHPKQIKMATIKDGKGTLALAAFDESAKLQKHEFGRPKPGPNDVSIKILYCGMCHSDLHACNGDWQIGGKNMLVPS